MIYHYIFPIVTFHDLGEGKFQPIEAVGTGFTMGDHSLITCWHCVSGALDEDVFYGIPFGTDMTHPTEVAIIDKLKQAASGADLAIGSIALSLQPLLRLAGAPPEWGSDVLSLGFPHPVNTVDSATSLPLIRTQSRALKGYVSAVAPHATSGAREAKYFELGMNVPMWASGSPLLDAGTLEIVGVLAGELSSEIGDSGAFTVGLALHLDVLRAALSDLENLP